MQRNRLHLFVVAGLLGASSFIACGGPSEPAVSPNGAPSASASAESSASAAPAASASVAASAAPSADPTPAVASASAAPAPSAAAAPAAPGDIVGTITLPGGKPGKGAVIYLEDGPKEEGKGLTAWVDNKQMAFFPFIAVMAVGGKATFHNSEAFPHNIFANDPEKFDLGNLAPNSTKTRVFNKAGAYTLLCNLHPSMIGYLFVSPSTVYATADQSGKFRIKAAPGGSWHINAWAPRMKGTAKSITVAGAETTVDFTLAKE